jgi:glycosyltransferase involved in cell wall biosynthesis
MKILIVNCVFDPEPVVSAQIGKSLVEKLVELKHNVTVISPYPSRPSGFQFNKKIKYSNKITEVVNIPHFKELKLPSFVFPKSNPIGRLFEGISFGWHGYKYIINNAKHLDVVYMNTWPLFGQLGVALACKKSQIKYIIHIQDIYPESLVNKLPRLLADIVLKLLMPIEKYVIRNSSKIVVISQYMKSKIFSRGKIDNDKISIVNNWQDENVFDKENFDRIENERLTFMYLGNIGPVANIPFVIQTFYDSNIGAKLIIAGSGSKRKECEELVSALGTNNIQFLDVPAGEVPKTQSRADILILSTISKGAKTSIPSKLPAYMFSKKPIFALIDENTDTYNAIIEARCGWVVNPEEKEEIIEQFKVIARIQKSGLLEMGINGCKYAKENFSKEKNLNRLTKIIINT